MLGIFKKKNRVVVREAERSLSRIDRDIYLIQQWISHLREREEETRNSHFQHMEVTRRDISQINKWLNYLHAHNAEIHRFVRETTNNILELKQSYKDIASRLENIEKGHLRTAERTSQGQIEDKRTSEKDLKKGIIEEKEKEMQTSYKSEFNGSQIEMITLLYRADRPMS